MNSQRRHTYAESGVDILVEEEAIRALTSHFTTKTEGCGSPINIKGAYAGLLDMGGFILGFTTDGVGSKVLVATEMSNWRTIGIDCVAMNVNDLYAMGLQPIAFVDYLAMETVEPSIANQIGQGLAKGAEIANVSILGGETASLPDIIRGFDLAGSCVGIAAHEKLVTGQKIQEGDAIVGIPSTGIHSNGLTLARKLLAKYSLHARYGNMERTLGEELLVPTRIYSEVIDISKNCEVHGMAHITGGGLLNLKRITRLGFNLSDPLAPQEIFKMIQAEGVDAEEMYKTFNMGMGFAIVAPENEISRITSFSNGARKVGTISNRGIQVQCEDGQIDIAK
ncbi:MAG: phosphoribosylformylglycinamidine cyclo-ligase [Halobacteriota archaeon]